MSEVICNYCGKTLSKEKGEIDHGCLTCHGQPYVHRIDALKEQVMNLVMLAEYKGKKITEMNAKIKKAREILNTGLEIKDYKYSMELAISVLIGGIK